MIYFFVAHSLFCKIEIGYTTIPQSKRNKSEYPLCPIWILQTVYPIPYVTKETEHRDYNNEIAYCFCLIHRLAFIVKHDVSNDMCHYFSSIILS